MAREINVSGRDPVPDQSHDSTQDNGRGSGHFEIHATDEGGGGDNNPPRIRAQGAARIRAATCCVQISGLPQSVNSGVYKSYGGGVDASQNGEDSLMALSAKRRPDPHDSGVQHETGGEYANVC